ncbi:GNAT family N-acetyltransferase [Ferrovibrio sp.]|uniref:GNAT family N-acetyltransferase n=1 Tax=Ferrovibrio sp. TaxID=1917215 RepID=UPI000CB2273B|nr:GNAT family N-acetyltransferase [Ferrovibrio sp.]PJI42122.1 MAG: GNAT family N-acetyltransferase [Ferrovibrio sp.]
MTDSAPALSITAARTADDVEAARRLFLAYAQSLDFSLCFQGFDEELAGLPGKYAADSRGALLLAKRNGEAVGVVGLRNLGDGIAEMKRLYIDPAGRGHNFGRALTDAVLAEARRFGYRAIRLDTFPSMVAANRIYDALGFRDIPAYYDNPLPGARYRELEL